MGYEYELAQCLAQWPQWPLDLTQPPRVVAEFTGGRTNKSYLITANTQRYVLRLEHKDPHSLGIQRDFEERIYRALGPLGICPKLYFNYRKNDDLNGLQTPCSYSLFEYIEGRTWTEQDFKQPSQREKLQRVIARYQHQPLPCTAFDYVAHLQHYRQQLMAAGVDKNQLKNENYNYFINKFEAYLTQNSRRVLTHHDLNPENIVEAPERLVILDWEYSGFGLPEFDPLSVDVHFMDDPLAHAQTRETIVIVELFFWLNYYWNLMQNIKS